MANLDWLDISNALDVVMPGWRKLDDGPRHEKWEFAKALIGAFQDGQRRVCVECRKTREWWEFYRCWDCRGWLCEGCVRTHFGPRHVPHPITQTQLESRIAGLESALEPFAKMAEAHDAPEEWDEHAPIWGERPTFGQLRKARAALEPTP